MGTETRISVPCKRGRAADLRPGPGGHGEIGMELGGGRLLGHVLLWPHVRPWRYAMPQPMLRAVPDAAHVAQIIAETRARFGAIDRHLSEIKETVPASSQSVAKPAAISGRLVPVLHREQGLEGAPA